MFYSLSDSQLIDLLQTGPIAISISSVGWENYGSGVLHVLQLVKLIMLFFLLVIPPANGLSRTSGVQLGAKVVILELLDHLQTIVK